MKGKRRQNHLSRIGLGSTMVTIHNGVGLGGEHIVNGRVGVDGQADLDNIRYVTVLVALHQGDEHGIPSHVGADLVGIGEAEGHLRLNGVVRAGKRIDSFHIVIHAGQNSSDSGQTMRPPWLETGESSVIPAPAKVTKPKLTFGLELI